MTAEQFVRQKLRSYQNLAAKLRILADYSDDIIQRTDYLARASAYDISADDMLEILEDAEDINTTKGVSV